MTALIFVHGAGVRRERLDALLASIERNLADVEDLDVIPCRWYETDGADLRFGGASLPGERPGGPDTDDASTDIWAQLYDDPLCELDAMAAPEAATTLLSASEPAEDVRDLLTRLADDLSGVPTLHGRLAGMGLVAVFQSACESVRDSEEFVEAMHAVDGSKDAFRVATARAVIATAMARAGGDADTEPAIPPLSAASRDLLVADVVEALSGVSFDLSTAAGSRAFRLVMRAGGTQWISRRRRRYAPFTGDILRYQTRGEGIRKRIRDAVAQGAEASPTVVLVGHSLGGIASLDMLVETPTPQVRLLVTVGSQAPFLYEADALTSLRADQPLPSDLPDWLNIWDKRDMLSTVAAGVFKSQRIRDVEVDNGQPFPWAHSAYWDSPAVFDLLRDRLREQAS